jgi:hypothetical protein
MPGAGPEWIHARRNNVVTNLLGGEVPLDFKFWPMGKHQFGWYLESAGVKPFCVTISISR